jgi:hypothetical protein
MGVVRVWVVYEPTIYSVVLVWAFKSLGVVQVLDQPSAAVDVIVFPTNQAGRPDVELLPESAPQARLIAVSPAGDCGWRRLPGESTWQKIQPLGLENLCGEVCAGRDHPTVIAYITRPTSRIGPVFPPTSGVVAQTP